MPSVQLSETAATCYLCGYSAATIAVEEAPPPQPSELDARRELARDFRIDSLLERPPGPIVYLARDADERSLALAYRRRARGMHGQRIRMDARHDGSRVARKRGFRSRGGLEPRSGDA